MRPCAAEISPEHMGADASKRKKGGGWCFVALRLGNDERHAEGVRADAGDGADRQCGRGCGRLGHQD